MCPAEEFGNQLNAMPPGAVLSDMGAFEAWSFGLRHPKFIASPGLGPGATNSFNVFVDGRVKPGQGEE